MSLTVTLNDEMEKLLTRVSLNREITKEKALARAFALMEISENALYNGSELAVVTFDQYGGITKVGKILGMKKGVNK